MIFRTLILTLVLASCSSSPLTHKELFDLSVSYKKIPTLNAATAKEYMKDQREYLVLLHSDPLSTYANECGKFSRIGEVQEKKGSLTLVSGIFVDALGKPTGCRPQNVSVWDIYFYCKGENYLTNLKISQSHLMEFKDHSLCK